MCLVANALTTSSRESSTSSPGLRPTSFGWHPPAVEPLEGAQEGSRRPRRPRPAGRSWAAPSSSSDGERRSTGSAAMWSRCVWRDEPGRRGHERPGLGSQVEAQLQLGNAPVRLDRGPRIALDREVLVLPASGPARCPPDGRAIPPTIPYPPPTVISSASTSRDRACTIGAANRRESEYNAARLRGRNRDPASVRRGSSTGPKGSP